MTTRLAHTVAVDMDATSVTLKPAGILARDNVRGRIAVASRARRVPARFTVHADLDFSDLSIPHTTAADGVWNGFMIPVLSTDRNATGADVAQKNSSGVGHIPLLPAAQHRFPPVQRSYASLPSRKPRR